MNGRACIFGILNRRPIDRLSWTTLVDNKTLSIMQEPERSMEPLAFYRRIGCDVLQFGNYGLPQENCVPGPVKTVNPESHTEYIESPDGTVVVTNRTPWGTLTSAFRNVHPVKYPVETADDLRILRNIWANMQYEEVSGHEEGFHRIEALIGDRGMYIPTLDPSPVQQLIETDMGLENFYFFLQDRQDDMEVLMDIMHERRKHEYEVAARRTPAEALIPVENTSSTLTSPSIYERYSLPQIRDYCDIAHRYGKKVILHMCGRLQALLPIIAQTGADGYNAMTPPTVGDTAFNYAMDLLGEDTVILGGCFSVFQKPGVTRDEIHAELDALYTPRIRKAHLCLAIPADGLPTPLERFMWVAEWMEKNGGK